jgi:hypothetical protein
MIFPFIFLSLFPLFITAHSHLECTDFRNGTCAGFPRHYTGNKAGYENTPESKDRNFVVPQGRRFCPPSAAPEYTETYPMAEAQAGSQLQLVWPARGHADQPSSSVIVHCLTDSNKQDISSHFNGNAWDAKMVKVMDAPYDRCEGKDISWRQCSGMMTVPESLLEGKHTCVWEWELTGQMYVDCFEIAVSAADMSTSATTAPAAEPGPVPVLKKIESTVGEVGRLFPLVQLFDGKLAFASSSVSLDSLQGPLTLVVIPASATVTPTVGSLAISPSTIGSLTNDPIAMLQIDNLTPTSLTPTATLRADRVSGTSTVVDLHALHGH